MLLRPSITDVAESTLFFRLEECEQSHFDQFPIMIRLSSRAHLRPTSSVPDCSSRILQTIVASQDHTLKTWRRNFKKNAQEGGRKLSKASASGACQ